MSPSFERRLTILSAVVIGGGIFAIVIALALFAFSVYIGSLNRDVHDAIVDVRSVLQESGGPRNDARLAARRLAAQLFSPQIRISLLDQRRRVDLYRRSATEPYEIVATGRNSIARDYPTNTFAARSTLALATLFGLNAQRAVLGPLLVVVRVQEAELIRGVAQLLQTLLLALIGAVALSIAFARLLVLQALRPLNDVTAALERFAAGDLTPRVIPAHADHQLQDLTRAYNGAIAQMQAAFGERDEAHGAMRQFMADAGHQLRTPLTVIRGFIGVLLRGDLRSPADHADILTTMNGQCVLMGSLIEKLILLDVWDHADQSTLPEVVDVSQLVEDVVLPLAEASPDRAIELSVAPGAMARIDPIGCSHALTNLVDNALKYAPAGPIEVTLRFDARFIQIVVADRGPGMTEDEVQHIFDRFYRGPLRRDVPGSGLGLPIARSAIERAHGTLIVESSPGHGARFIVRLPTALVPPVGIASAEAPLALGARV
jgi:two-component system, OmpR family, sensor kinase